MCSLNCSKICSGSLVVNCRTSKAERVHLRQEDIGISPFGDLSSKDEGAHAAPSISVATAPSPPSSPGSLTSCPSPPLPRRQGLSPKDCWDLNEDSLEFSLCLWAEGVMNVHRNVDKEEHSLLFSEPRNLVSPFLCWPLPFSSHFLAISTKSTNMENSFPSPELASARKQVLASIRPQDCTVGVAAYSWSFWIHSCSLLGLKAVLETLPFGGAYLLFHENKSLVLLEEFFGRAFVETWKVHTVLYCDW